MKTITQQLNIKEFPFFIKDKNGREIYYENSSGYWQKNEFDSDGREIYFENSNGFWIKKEFDSNGNCIYFKTSNGYWEKREYDLNGSQIYLETSKGEIIDNRLKPTCDGKIVEIDGKKYKLVSE